MNGYSVEEAAEVLGIPQGRVWELIARGVLFGGAEGGSTMRVYLRPPAAPPVTTPEPGASERDRHANGNGGGHPEASPFRELLTEFRSLTERYGQALLALGEARGEVASLRSRVDLLEARMDMRLPLRAASTVAWEMPERRPAPATPEPAAEPEPAADSAPPEAASPAAVEGPMEPEALLEPEALAPAIAVEVPLPPVPSVIPVDITGLHPRPPADEVRPPDAVEAAPPAAPVAEEVEAVPPAAPVAEEVEAAASRAEAPRRRLSGGHAAVAGLAEALARAEDPALSDLPGGREAADALAALKRDLEAASSEPTTAEAAEAPEPVAEPIAEAAAEAADALASADSAAVAPHIELADEPGVERVSPEAEPMPTADEATPAAAIDHGERYTTEVVEPDWFADGDFAWLDAPTADAGQPEVTAEADATPDAAPSAVDEEPVLATAEAIQDAFDEPDASHAGGAVTEAQDADADEPEEPVAAEPDEPTVAADPDEPTVAAEPDEAEPAGDEQAKHAAAEEPEPPARRTAALAIQDAFDEPDVSHAGGAAPHWPTVDRPEPAPAGFGLFRGQREPAPGKATVDEPRTAVREEVELMRLGDEFEAGELEVATPGWRSRPAEQRPGEAEYPALRLSDAEIEQLARDEGWDDTEVDAIRDLLARPIGAPATERPAAPPPAALQADDTLPRSEIAPHGEDTSPPSAPATERPTAPPGPPAPDADWLRNRRGPAATAYRRLRRLFQG